MAKYRQGRINEEIQKEMTSILRRVKDPRVSDAFISITAADCTADLKYAKIYLSFLGEYNETEVRRGLKAATGYVRRRIGETVRMRSVPEPIFILDRSLEQGIRINEILKNLEDGNG